MPSRRRFCRSAGAALFIPSILGPFAGAAATKPSNILVAIMLLGGNDGLNTVIPLLQYGPYSDLRKPESTPSESGMGLNIPLAGLALTAFDSNYRTSASKASEYAFNPNMQSLRSLYAQGKVAVINGVGIPSADLNRLSHETGQFDWQSGTINKTNELTVGWLGRTLDSAPGGALPAMMSYTGEVPLLMRGYRNGPLTVNPPLEQFDLVSDAPNPADGLARTTSFNSIDNGASGSTTGDFVREDSQSAYRLTSALQAAAAREPVTDYPEPQTYLAQQLEQIARVVLSGSGVSAHFAVQAGYDTHSSQQSFQPALLSDLSDSIAAFYAYLASKRASSNVVIMTFSDFGRRAAGNSTLGTDHGTSSVSLVIGDPVKGGSYGSYPSLTNLDQDGNLQVGIDFRNQLCDIIGYLGGDGASILGHAYSKIGFV